MSPTQAAAAADQPQSQIDEFEKALATLGATAREFDEKKRASQAASAAAQAAKDSMSAAAETMQLAVNEVNKVFDQIRKTD